jgi:hypothetical protein
MKKIIWYVVFMLLFWQSALPQQVTEPVKDKAYYLNKSKKEKTKAWILLGGGTAMLVAGIVGFNKEFDLDGGGIPQAMVAILGGAFVIASPFAFSSASKNKAKAEAMAGVLLVPAPQVTQKSTQKTMPSIGMRITF